MDVDISDDSGRVQPISRISGKQQPVGMVGCSYEIFSFTTRSARDFAYFGPRGFLDEYDVKLSLSLK